MKDWNVVVTLRGREFGRALGYLRRFGDVAPSGFFNVLVMKVEDPRAFLEHLRAQAEQAPDSVRFLARVTPVDRTFAFHSTEEFESHAKEALREVAPALAGKSFHVRVHRRGFKGQLHSLDEEHVLDDALLDRLSEEGAPGRLSFEDPDAVVVVELVGTQAGTSVWTREDVRRHPFLHPD
jgi:tRNA(Ser,Leu) C12 N-acetylase TAN1